MGKKLGFANTLLTEAFRLLKDNNNLNYTKESFFNKYEEELKRLNYKLMKTLLRQIDGTVKSEHLKVPSEKKDYSSQNWLDIGRHFKETDNNSGGAHLVCSAYAVCFAAIEGNKNDAAEAYYAIATKFMELDYEGYNKEEAEKYIKLAYRYVEEEDTKRKIEDYMTKNGIEIPKDADQNSYKGSQSLLSQTSDSSDLSSSSSALLYPAYEESKSTEYQESKVVHPISEIKPRYYLLAALPDKEALQCHQENKDILIIKSRYQNSYEIYRIPHSKKEYDMGNPIPINDESIDKDKSDESIQEHKTSENDYSKMSATQISHKLKANLDDKGTSESPFEDEDLIKQTDALIEKAGPYIVMIKRYEELYVSENKLRGDLETFDTVLESISKHYDAKGEYPQILSQIKADFKRYSNVSIIMESILKNIQNAGISHNHELLKEYIDKFSDLLRNGYLDILRICKSHHFNLVKKNPHKISEKPEELNLSEMLGHYTIQPTQRIMRYQSLFQDILKNSTEVVEKQSFKDEEIEKTLKHLEEVVSACEAQSRRLNAVGFDEWVDETQAKSITMTIQAHDDHSRYSLEIQKDQKDDGIVLKQITSYLPTGYTAKIKRKARSEELYVDAPDSNDRNQRFCIIKKNNGKSFDIELQQYKGEQNIRLLIVRIRILMLALLNLGVNAKDISFEVNCGIKVNGGNKWNNGILTTELDGIKISASKVLSRKFTPEEFFSTQDKDEKEYNDITEELKNYVTKDTDLKAEDRTSSDPALVPSYKLSRSEQEKSEINKRLDQINVQLEAVKEEKESLQNDNDTLNVALAGERKLNQQLAERSKALQTESEKLREKLESISKIINSDEVTPSKRQKNIGTLPDEKQTEPFQSQKDQNSNSELKEIKDLLTNLTMTGANRPTSRDRGQGVLLRSEDEKGVPSLGEENSLGNRSESDPNEALQQAVRTKLVKFTTLVMVATSESTKKSEKYKVLELIADKISKKIDGGDYKGKKNELVNDFKAFMQVVLQQNRRFNMNKTKSGEKAVELFNTEDFKDLKELFFDKQGNITYSEVRKNVAPDGQDPKKYFSSKNNRHLVFNFFNHSEYQDEEFKIGTVDELSRRYNRDTGQFTP